ncbi:MAG: hypothetical protein PWQ40_350 [Archaeoglobus sp.]|jgi:hypothetical protein|uniref:Uncharacterized protein n=2 Tax=Archaeoglobus fulgidus TaxID=2234 RepID=A0A075WBF6_ARCFL|nr:hypothetical protein AFULGI_00005080 [Archaeoglobus fulgidus DSM 8774]KUJ92612.1 MAG: hypothetical protein XD40_2194 [Archaeoglobus fulgidus]KUK05769.1 MAG: hypothetical protein XD48_1995 [Archaeoglobus fulgidus]MDI3496981.1 hypothetical protein [Archaeoglobus sp.]
MGDKYNLVMSMEIRPVIEIKDLIVLSVGALALLLLQLQMT